MLLGSIGVLLLAVSVHIHGVRHHSAGGGFPDESTETQSGQSQVPNQLILTGKAESIEHLAKGIQDNILAVKRANPELKVRYFSDQACEAYVAENYGEELKQEYARQKLGALRGDICRLAVLLQEGGFYMDLDLQPRVPLRELVDDHTTFFAAYEGGGGTVGKGKKARRVLNALMGARKGSAVVKHALDAIRHWEDPGAQHAGWMGPATLGEGLSALEAQTCPEADTTKLQWACGDEVVRLFVEEPIRCDLSPRGMAECPTDRRANKFMGAKYGLFALDGDSRQIVGWSRFASCPDWGCGA